MCRAPPPPSSRGFLTAANEITGSYTLTQTGPEQGFLLMRETNQTLTLTVPGAFSTSAEGISANGNEITGSYTLTQGGPEQGFVATVPAPSALLLVLSGVLCIAACATRVRGETKRNE